MDAPRRRMTRVEAQQETRARLIEAGLNLIAEEGVGAASIRGICERAGFSQGAFYSNFSSKDDLLLAIVGTHMTRIARTLVELVETTEGLGLDDSLERLGARLSDLAQSPVLSRLVVEMHLHAQRDAAFAARFAEVTGAYQAEFRRITETLMARHSLVAAQSSEVIAAAMMALWFGSIVQARTPDAPSVGELQLGYFRAVTTA